MWKARSHLDNVWSTISLSRIVSRLITPGSVAFDIAGVGLMQVVRIGATVLTSILLARTFGPSNYGLFTFVSSITFIVALPLSGGLPDLIVREVARYELHSEWALMAGLMRRAHQFILIATIVIVLPVALIALIKWKTTSSPIWPVLFVSMWMIPLLGLSSIRAGYLKGRRRALAGNSPEFLVRPVVFLGSILILLGSAHATLVGAAIAQVASIACAFAVGHVIFVRQRQQLLRINAVAYDFRAWIRDWIPFTLLAGTALANQQIQTLLLGSLSTNFENGLYGAANNIGNLVSVPLLAMNLVVAPHFARICRQKDFQKLQRLATFSARIATLCALPVAIGFVVLGKPIIILVFGPEYAGAYLPGVILVIAQVMNVAFGSAGQILNMSGNERLTTRAIMVGLMVNTIIGVMLVPRLGAIGAAIAGATSTLVWNTILVWGVQRRLATDSTILGWSKEKTT